jgi:molybdopterin-guanine dinucleotide biosynthesis protein A
MHAQISGLVLSGGAGRRMGGRDKGWVEWQGRPLIEHVLVRLHPQVAEVFISANRNRDRYASLDAEVFGDAAGAEVYPGPLAGIAAGLVRVRTDWLLVVPCDAPHLPLDLADRLAAARGAARAAVARTEQGVEPLFCLLSRDLAGEANAALRSGEGSVHRWLAGLNAVAVDFDDARSFTNVNTADDERSAA